MLNNLQCNITERYGVGMINLNVKKDGKKVTAEYLLKANDRIDNLTLGMLVNNDIKEIVSVVPVQIDNNRFFRYDITGMITLKEYLGEYVKKDRILKSFYSIALAIREATEYMINWTSFSLDLDEIYINEQTGTAKLLCLPLLMVINDGNLCNFFKNVLFSSQFDMEESGDYVGRLINLLNPKSFTLDKFIYELEEMLELEHSDVADVADEAEEADEDETVSLKEPDKITAEAETAEKTEIVTVKEVETEQAETASDAVVQEETVSVNKTVKPQEQKPFLIRMGDKQKVVIDKEVFYVGSNETEADYCIAGNAAVDEKHAYFIRHDDEYFVVDNNTKGRTYLNRVEIPSDEEIFIPHGAHVAFGTEEFEFKMHE